MTLSFKKNLARKNLLIVAGKPRAGHVLISNHG